MILNSLAILMLIALVIYGVAKMMKSKSLGGGFLTLLMIVGLFYVFKYIYGPKHKEFEVKAKVVSIAPEAYKLGVVVNYNFTAFDGKDTLKVTTTREAQTIKLNDTITIKKMVISSKLEEVDSVRYSY